MRTAIPLFITLLCPPCARALDWRTPIALEIPARFEINLRGIPSRCYQVVRPLDGRLTAEVLGPGRWNVCIGDMRCPVDCMSGNLRKATTEPLTNGTHYFVMVERSGADVMATLAIYPATGAARAPLATNWRAIMPARNFRRGGYKIIDSGGQLTLLSPDGNKSRAFYSSAGTITAKDWNATGTVSADGRRIDWSNGGYWEAEGPAPATGPDITGSWIAVIPAKSFRRGGYSITGSAEKLRFLSYDGASSTGYYLDASTVLAEQWKVTGKVRSDGRRIDWSNETYWER